MNIYDCFMYFDEDLLLDIRLNILDKYVKKFVITESLYFVKEIFCFGTKLMRVGSNVKVTINEVISPSVIIQPKSIIGFISLKIKDRKAITVVKTVYKIGQNILLVVIESKSIIFLLG